MAPVRYQRLAPRTKWRHLLDRRSHPDHHGAAHDAVADVELLDLRDGGDGHHVLVGEPVAGVHEESHVGGVARGAPELVERGVALRASVWA